MGWLPPAQGQTALNPPGLCAKPPYDKVCKQPEFKLLLQGVPKNQPAAYLLSHTLFYEALGDDGISRDLAHELMAQVHQSAADATPKTREDYLNSLAERLYALESSRLSTTYAPPKARFVTEQTGQLKLSEGVIPPALQAAMSAVNSAQGSRALTAMTLGLATSTQAALGKVTLGALHGALKADAQGTLKTALEQEVQALNEAQQAYRVARAAVSKELPAAQLKDANLKLQALSDAAQKAATVAAERFSKAVPALEAQLNGLAADAKAEAKAALGSALTQGLDKLKDTSDAELGALQSNLVNNVTKWTTLSSTLTGVTTAISNASTTLDTSLTQVTTVITQVQQVQKTLANPAALNMLTKQVTATAVATFVEQELLASLPAGPARNLAVLHGAYRALPGAQETLSKSLTLLQDAKTFDAKLSGAAGAVSATLKVAKQLGLEVPKDLANNMAMLQGGLQLAAAFSGADPMAAIGMASSLLGGGSLGDLGGMGGSKPDPAAAERHAQMMAALSAISAKLDAMDRKLDEILALQREALAKLADLSKQLADTRADILKAIAHLQTGMNYLLDMKRVDVLEPFQSCARFWDARQDELEQSPGQRYGSLASRRAAFKEGNPDAYKNCRKFLNKDTFQNGIARGEPHTLLELRLVETASRADGTSSNDVGKGFFTRQWEPMLALTQAMLNLKGEEQPYCAARLLAAMASGPTAFGPTVHKDYLGCGNQDLPPTAPALYRSGLAAATYTHAETLFTKPTSFTLVKNTGDVLAFILPFELMLPFSATSKPAELPTTAQLLNHKINGTIQTSMSRFLDLVYWSVAQESMHAGAPIADEAARLLIASGFGTKLGGKNLIPSASKADFCGRDRSALLENGALPEAQRSIERDAAQYRQVLCLMSINPAFASNVTARLAYRVFAAQHKDVANSVYQLAYYQPVSPSLFELTFSDASEKTAKLYPRDVPAEGGASSYVSWTLKLPWLNDGPEEGRFLEVDLPSPFQFQTQRIVYGPQMRAVREFKNMTLQRLLYLDLGPAQAGNDPYAALRRQTVLSHPNPLGLVGFAHIRLK